MSEEQQRAFVIQRIYVKDVSFEAPGTPAVFKEEWAPKMNVQLQNSARQIDEGPEYEVEVTVTVTATMNDKTVYLAEVKQAALFTIDGMSADEREQLLGAYCPNIIFPYIRETVGSLVQRGGFPPFSLQPLNFDALFAQAKAQRDTATDTAH